MNALPLNPKLLHTGAIGSLMDTYQRAGPSNAGKFSNAADDEWLIHHDQDPGDSVSLLVLLGAGVHVLDDAQKA